VNKIKQFYICIILESDAALIISTHYAFSYNKKKYMSKQSRQYLICYIRACSCC